MVRAELSCSMECALLLARDMHDSRFRGARALKMVLKASVSDIASNCCAVIR